ncbi:DNA-binding protein [Motiliproteus sp. MSK22-1]|uniref:DNA-binding protein n=1 Tax=Motiliproteus sp. MSK22-1 TaxID=1897630 RepID=UPI000975EEC6|nr:DNA-binding protein [Motiliproteus sp. MSK22-1]OMH32698.1 hypothetical protein BGP75_14275 [Motiliproteus sp. MSK22-1]
MGKSTYDLVFETADELLKEGIRPSQQNVRARTGKGSATTIHKALNDWWQGLSARIYPTDDSNELPEFLTSAVADIWNQAQQRAQHQLLEQQKNLKQEAEVERKAMDAAKTEAREKIEQLVVKLDRAYQTIEQLQNNLEQSRKENLELERSLIKESALLAEHQREIKSQEKVICKMELQLIEQDSAILEQSRTNANNSSYIIDNKENIENSSASLVCENENLKSAISKLDTKLAEREALLSSSQDELLDAKRRYYRLESGLESDAALKEASFQEEINAKNREIERLLALVADKR